MLLQLPWKWHESPELKLSEMDNTRGEQKQKELNGLSFPYILKLQLLLVISVGQQKGVREDNGD